MRIDEVASEIEYRIYSPDKFGQRTLTLLAKLITNGNKTNNSSSIKRNLHNAISIAFARVDGYPVGVMVIKQPVASYKTKVFDAAGVPELDIEFDLELGYAVVDPRYRGQGVAKKLASLTGSISKSMYATTRQNNAAMIHILQSMGFTQTGTSYKGASGAELTLWTKR